ncbi:MAG: hypothetical protein [Microviridae sp.]|nr:MAG: hypothetical protein [Microviridae sp.]
MRKFINSEWQSAKAAIDIPTSAKTAIDIDACSLGTLSLHATCIDTGEEITLMVCQHQLHVKRQFDGFTNMELRSTKPLSARVLTNGKQVSEPMDDRTPPPPKEPTNILQQMRQVIKSELAANRESFLVNDTGLPGHEVDDDDDNFEEEMLEATQEQLDKLRKSDANPNPEPKPETKDATEPQQPPETPPAA